jgi:hypothetical protein
MPTADKSDFLTLGIDTNTILTQRSQGAGEKIVLRDFKIRTKIQFRKRA